MYFYLQKLLKLWAAIQTIFNFFIDKASFKIHTKRENAYIVYVQYMVNSTLSCVVQEINIVIILKHSKVSLHKRPAQSRAFGVGVSAVCSSKCCLYSYNKNITFYTYDLIIKWPNPSQINLIEDAKNIIFHYVKIENNRKCLGLLALGLLNWLVEKASQQPRTV